MNSNALLMQFGHFPQPHPLQTQLELMGFRKKLEDFLKAAVSFSEPQRTLQMQLEHSSNCPQRKPLRVM